MEADGVDDLLEPLRALGVGRNFVEVAGAGEPQLARGALRVARQIGVEYAKERRDRGRRICKVVVGFIGRQICKAVGVLGCGVEPWVGRWFCWFWFMGVRPAMAAAEYRAPSRHSILSIWVASRSQRSARSRCASLRSGSAMELAALMHSSARAESVARYHGSGLAKTRPTGGISMHRSTGRTLGEQRE
jgi:hypothetical protein